MNANIAITGSTHQNALVLPASSIFTSAGKTYALVATDKKQTKLTPVQTGITSLDGNVEIISGVSEGQMVAYFGK
jgi:multidrug efflux pump subunit AcrA (membrane-fusion protein)